MSDLPTREQVLKAVGVFAAPKRLAQRRARNTTAAVRPSAPASVRAAAGFLTPPNPALATEMAALAREAGMSPADIDAPVEAPRNFLISPPTANNQPLPPRPYVHGDAPDDPLKTKIAYNKFVADTFRDIFYEDSYTLEDTAPYRIRTMWRFAREIARTLGLLGPDEMLIEALEPVYMAPEDAPDDMEIFEGAPSMGFVDDPWIVPKIYRKDASKERTFGPDPSFRLSGGVTEAMLAAERVPQDKKCYYMQLVQAAEDGAQSWKPIFLDGITLLPPNVPHQYADPRTGRMSEEYDPSNEAHDPLLHCYIRMLKALSAHLYADQGTAVDANAGRYGLFGLFDPATVRLAMPSRVQILAWESLVIEDTLQQLVHNGQPTTRKYLFETYGLRPHEIQQLIRIAKVRARQAVEGDIEEDRGMMILRLEDLIRRSRTALDLRVELAALKNMAVILGLARVDPQSAITDFMQVVKEAHERRVAGGGMAALPPRQVVNQAV